MSEVLIRRLIYFVIVISTVRLFWIVVAGNTDGHMLALMLLVMGFIGFIIYFRPSFFGGGNPSGNTSGGGNVLLEDSVFERLRKRYETLAHQKIAEGRYADAARIYLNLLKDPYRAAQTLEEGKLYAEAGALYEKRLEQYEKAAECYTQAHLYPQAIALYQKLEDAERVGDTYLLMGDRTRAMHWYERVVENFSQNQQYVQAALLCRKKMRQPERAQQLLLQGWQRNEDAFNCLNNYFAAIEQPEALRTAIQTIYRDTTDGPRQEVLLHALQYEFDKGDAETQNLSRRLAHRIIAARAPENPDAVQAMRHFHKADKMLPRDVQKFRAGKAAFR